MTELLIKALASGLSLWQHKDARKYLDQVIELREEFYIEYNKDRPDDANLDHIDDQLRRIAEAFSSQVGTSYLKDK